MQPKGNSAFIEERPCDGAPDRLVQVQFEVDSARVDVAEQGERVQAAGKDELPQNPHQQMERLSAALISQERLRARIISFNTRTGYGFAQATGFLTDSATLQAQAQTRSAAELPRQVYVHIEHCDAVPQPGDEVTLSVVPCKRESGRPVARAVIGCAGGQIGGLALSSA